MKGNEFHSLGWDARKIRRVREFGWFRQNEGQLIEAARRRRAEADEKRRSAEADMLRRAESHKCLRCGGDIRSKAIDDVQVEECVSCAAICVDHAALERLLTEHEAHRHGFPQRLIGNRHERR